MYPVLLSFLLRSFGLNPCFVNNARAVVLSVSVVGIDSPTEIQDVVVAPAAVSSVVDEDRDEDTATVDPDSNDTAEARPRFHISTARTTPAIAVVVAVVAEGVADVLGVMGVPIMALWMEVKTEGAAAARDPPSVELGRGGKEEDGDEDVAMVVEQKFN